MGFIVNGRLEYAIVTGGGVDYYNRPLPADVTWSNPIHCHIQTYNHKNDGIYKDGVFTNSSYKVWIEMYHRDNDFNIDRVRLTHDGRDIGEWQVQNVSYKYRTGRIEVIVGNRINRQV